MSMSLTIDRLFNTTPERLYDVWTSAKHLTRWFGVTVDADARVGGEINFHFEPGCDPVKGRYLAADPYRYVSFTWRSGADSPDTTVHVTLQPEGKATRLTLKHEGFLDQKSFDAHDEGWLTYMEMWSVLVNAGPEEALRATISEVFPSKVDLVAALAGWLGKPVTQLKIVDDAGVQRITNGIVEARLKPCRFGTSLALAEWGFSSEADRLAAREKWLGRFSSLKEAHA